MNDPSTPSKALIVEGGGMRGIFTAGVLDVFLDEKFDPFNMYFGVSVGASILSSFLARQNKRHYRIFTQIAPSPDFISLKRMLTGGSYMDLDWLWNTVESSIPLDTNNIDKNLSGKECYIVCTGVETGAPMYLSPMGCEWIEILKASSALPLLYRHFPRISGIPMIDGGITDPLPIKEAYKRGARHVVIIRTRPEGFYKSARLSPLLGSMFFNKYPRLKEKIRSHVRRYNDSVDFIVNPPADLTITQISPQAPTKTGRSSTQISSLIDDYLCGIEMGMNALNQIGDANSLNAFKITVSN